MNPKLDRSLVLAHCRSGYSISQVAQIYGCSTDEVIDALAGPADLEWWVVVAIVAGAAALGLLVGVMVILLA